MSKIFTWYLLIALAWISGCSAITPSGLIAASRLDPLTTEPSNLRLALAVPKALRLRDGDAQLRLAFQLDGAKGYMVDATVPLQLRAGDPRAPSSLETGDVVYLAQFAPQDAMRLRAAQEKILRLRASGAVGQGSLSVAVQGGCLTSPDRATLALTTWLQAAPQSEFVLLTRRQDVLAALTPEEAAVLQDSLQPCPTE